MMPLYAITPANGMLGAHELATVDTGRNGPQRLRLDAARLWAAMLAAGMPAGCLTSGYRDRAAQADEVARAKAGKTPSAAPVGRSFHGEGIAADVAEPARSWLRAWGAPYGVIFDTVEDEPWHVLIVAALASALTKPAATVAPVRTNPEESDDMLQLVERLYVEELGREPDIAGAAGWLDVGLSVGATAMVKAFRGSPPEAATVRKAYADFLGRAPSAADVTSWLKTPTIAGVRAGIAGSDEAKARQAAAK